MPIGEGPIRNWQLAIGSGLNVFLAPKCLEDEAIDIIDLHIIDLNIIIAYVRDYRVMADRS